MQLHFDPQVNANEIVAKHVAFISPLLGARSGKSLFLQCW